MNFLWWVCVVKTVIIKRGICFNCVFVGLEMAIWILFKSIILLPSGFFFSVWFLKWSFSQLTGQNPNYHSTEFTFAIISDYFVPWFHLLHLLILWLSDISHGVTEVCCPLFINRSAIHKSPISEFRSKSPLNSPPTVVLCDFYWRWSVLSSASVLGLLWVCLFLYLLTSMGWQICFLL